MAMRVGGAAVEESLQCVAHCRLRLLQISSEGHWWGGTHLAILATLRLPNTPTGQGVAQ